MADINSLQRGILSGFMAPAVYSVITPLPYSELHKNYYWLGMKASLAELLEAGWKNVDTGGTPEDSAQWLNHPGGGTLCFTKEHNYAVAHLNPNYSPPIVNDAGVMDALAKIEAYLTQKRITSSSDYKQGYDDGYKTDTPYHPATPATGHNRSGMYKRGWTDGQEARFDI